MAKAKGLARPQPKGGGDSKRGLVISLVFACLFVIGLGVSTYYGFAGQKEFDDKAKEADKKLKSMEADRDWYKYQALLERAYIFGTLSKNEEPDLPVLRERAGSMGQGQDDVHKAFQKLDQQLGWDQAQRKVKTSFTDLVQKLQNDLAGAQGLNKKLMDDLEQLRAATTAQRAADQRALKDYEARLQKLNDAFVELEKTKSKEFVDLVAKNNEQLQSIEDMKKQAQNVKEEEEKKEHQHMIKKMEMDQRIARLEQKIPREDALAHEAPRGKIVSLDRKGEYAFINLGSSDRVHPQLTFSVFSQNYASDKAREKTRKARVEVVEVLYPHLSRARISDATDPKRDPVVSGDLLFNPAWSPNLKQHIAIAGLIDLTGDGTDNTEEFVKNLERQNIAIDAVLDLKTMELRGRMGFNTSYLVLGEVPAYEVGENILKETDPRTQRKREVAEKLSAIQAQAMQLGVTVIPAQRFMALIGYRVPKIIAPADYTIRGPRPLPKPAENGEGAKKPDAEPAKKEDMKDDKEKTDKDAPKEKKIG